MFFKAFEIERRSFSTDYMEWNLRSSARLRRTPGARDDREREVKPDHDIATNNKTKIPVIVALFSDTERQTVGSFDSERAGRSRRARSRESSAGPAGQRTEPDCTEVKGNPTSSKEARRAT